LRFPQQSCPRQASIGVVLPPSGSKDALWLLSFPCFCRMASPTIRARKSNPSSIGAYFFGALDLTETPSRIATLRIRSGVRFIVFAISSSVLEALASSMTRRSCLNDQPLGISVQFVLKNKAATRRMFARRLCHCGPGLMGKLSGGQSVLERECDAIEALALYTRSGLIWNRPLRG
jgi:hypothetical protein